MTSPCASDHRSAFLDGGFDGDGRRTVDFGETNDYASAVAVDSQDRMCGGWLLVARAEPAMTSRWRA